MNEDKARVLAQRIARELAEQASGNDAGEVARLRAQVTELSRRLAHTEHRKDVDYTDAGYMNITRATDTRASFAHSTDASSSRTQPVPEHHPTQIGTGGTYVSAVHPSQQRFGIDEAVTELVDFLQHAHTSQKTCDLEPGNRPCDHCEMCSTRGF